MTRRNHCPTCTCIGVENVGFQPRNVCEIEGLGCLGEDIRLLTDCYSCGSQVCRGPSCSALVSYRLVKNAWCRMCATCVRNRHDWGDLTRYSAEALLILADDGVRIDPLKYHQSVDIALMYRTYQRMGI